MKLYTLQEEQYDRGILASTLNVAERYCQFGESIPVLTWLRHKLYKMHKNIETRIKELEKRQSEVKTNSLDDTQ